MKKTFEVVWAENAENDLPRIIEYIARDNRIHATNIFHKIQRKTSRLYHFPTRGRIIPELHDQGVMLYREVVIPPWRIMYRISGQSVFVMAVVDSRRNIEDVLLERLLNLE